MSYFEGGASILGPGSWQTATRRSVNAVQKGRAGPKVKAKAAIMQSNLVAITAAAKKHKRELIGMASHGKGIKRISPGRETRSRCSPTQVLRCECYADPSNWRKS
jgi:hypothetical protein